MDLLDDMRKQYAVYWAPIGVNDYNHTVFGVAAELRVRWDDVQVAFVDKKGGARTSRSVVYVDRTLELDGVLWKGRLADVPDQYDPFRNPDAWEIQQFNEVVTIDNDDTLRTAML